MLLIVGLGNPDSKYAGNRHNIGFMAVDSIVHRHNFSPVRKRFHSHYYEGVLGTTKTIILKPQTYMNNSGQAVVEAANFYKIPPENIIVFHDELDLDPNKIRVKLGGGHAGHNGLRSIIAHIGGNFHRVRLGIGHPGTKDQVHNYVLGDFAKADKKWLEPLMNSIAEKSIWLGFNNIARFQSDVAAAIAPPTPKKQKSKGDATPATKENPAQTPSPKEGPMAAALRVLKKITGDK